MLVWGWSARHKSDKDCRYRRFEKYAQQTESFLQELATDLVEFVNPWVYNRSNFFLVKESSHGRLLRITKMEQKLRYLPPWQMYNYHYWNRFSSKIEQNNLSVTDTDTCSNSRGREEEPMENRMQQTKRILTEREGGGVHCLLHSERRRQPEGSWGRPPTGVSDERERRNTKGETEEIGVEIVGRKLAT